MWRDEEASSMFGFARRYITVTFFDETSGALVSSVKMPFDRLPDTFVANTELNMDGARYVVVRAVPSTKEEFKKTRLLKVSLRRLAVPPP
jgi:hypothetical protein